MGDRGREVERQSGDVEGDEYTIEPTVARYVRVVMLKNSANIGVHVGDLEVYAAEK